MLDRALDAGVPAAGVVGDSVYGHSAELRQRREARGPAYVLAVPRHEYVWVDFQPVQVQTLQAAADWAPRACGMGAKGPRVYDWQVQTLAAPAGLPGARYLLCRRSREDPVQSQIYLGYAARPCALETLVQVAGTRGCIESGCEAAKGEVGLDEYEVRSATGGYRHITLALWAMALLAVIRATTLPAAPAPKKKAHPQPEGFQTVPRAGLGLSLTAIRQQLWQLWQLCLHILPAAHHGLAWLDWKRYHQWVAQCCHYRRRTAVD